MNLATGFSIQKRTGGHPTQAPTQAEGAQGDGGCAGNNEELLWGKLWEMKLGRNSSEGPWTSEKGFGLPCEGNRKQGMHPTLTAWGWAPGVGPMG